jgi:hypothetical protein
MQAEGLPRAQHRYELRTTNDEAVYRTYRGMGVIDAFAREYAAGTLRFDQRDLKAGRGRFMGRPLVLYRIGANGKLTGYRKYEPDGKGHVKVTDSQAFTDAQKAAQKRQAEAMQKAAEVVGVRG